MESLLWQMQQGRCEEEAKQWQYNKRSRECMTLR
ncbi:BPTI/Kunitz-type proteinase inhibitor domain-containing protein [Candidatus Magnetaquicoccus inordinatus]